MSNTLFLLLARNAFGGKFKKKSSKRNAFGGGNEDLAAPRISAGKGFLVKFAAYVEPKQELVFVSSGVNSMSRFLLEPWCGVANQKERTTWTGS